MKEHQPVKWLGNMTTKISSVGDGYTLHHDTRFRVIRCDVEAWRLASCAVLVRDIHGEAILWAMYSLKGAGRLVLLRLSIRHKLQYGILCCVFARESVL